MAFGAALLLATTALAQAPTPSEPSKPAGQAQQPPEAPPDAAKAAAEAPKPPPPPEAPKPPPFMFALHGFVSMSAAWQDSTYYLSEGQQSLAAGLGVGGDRNSLTFDVRQSRFNFSVKGPKVLAGATPSMVLEIDFFQGFGGGSFGDVSLLNRMRLAYSELSWGDGATRIQFGQQNDLVFPMAPTSLSHIAFPLGYFTGNIGWRRPGVFGFHKLGTKELGVELAWEVARSQWRDVGTGAGVPASGIGGAFATPSQAEASSLPALEGRITVTGGKLFSAFVGGHWNQVDKSGIGTATGNPTVFNVQALNAGGKVTAGPLTVQATGFAGKNTDPLLGNFIEFKTHDTASAAPFPTASGITTVGVWGQVGFNVTKELGLWALWGFQEPNQDQAKAAGMTRLRNETTNAQIIYRDGGYGLSVEWINFRTRYAGYSGTRFANSQTETANQYMATANYFF